MDRNRHGPGGDLYVDNIHGRRQVRAIRDDMPVHHTIRNDPCGKWNGPKRNDPKRNDPIRKKTPPPGRPDDNNPCSYGTFFCFLIFLFAFGLLAYNWSAIGAFASSSIPNIISYFTGHLIPKPPIVQPPIDPTIPPPPKSGIAGRVCKLEKEMTRMSENLKLMQGNVEKLMRAMEDGTLSKIPEKMLDQIMDVCVGKLANGKQLTLRTLISAFQDTADKGHFFDEEKMNRAMDARLESFKEKLVICGPHIPPGQWCIPSNGTVDVASFKKELTDFIEKAIAAEINRVPPSGDVGNIVSLAIAKYDADKTAIPDLALEPGGGSIVTCRRTKFTPKKDAIISFMGIPVYTQPNTPRTIIQPGIVPGECWSFEGEGQAIMKLVAPAIITGVSLEHFPKVNSPTGKIDTAPKDFQVSGLTNYDDDKTEFIFGEYQYLDNYKPLQTFPVQRKSDTYFPYIQLKVKSNHGGNYTCIYRFRVHGSIFGVPPPTPPIDGQVPRSPEPEDPVEDIPC